MSQHASDGLAEAAILPIAVVGQQTNAEELKDAVRRWKNRKTTVSPTAASSTPEKAAKRLSKTTAMAAAVENAAARSASTARGQDFAGPMSFEAIMRMKRGEDQKSAETLATSPSRKSAPENTNKRGPTAGDVADAMDSIRKKRSVAKQSEPSSESSPLNKPADRQAEPGLIPEPPRPPEVHRGAAPSEQPPVPEQQRPVEPKQQRHAEPQQSQPATQPASQPTSQPAPQPATQPAPQPTTQSIPQLATQPEVQHPREAETQVEPAAASEDPEVPAAPPVTPSPPPTPSKEQADTLLEPEAQPAAVKPVVPTKPSVQAKPAAPAKPATINKPAALPKVSVLPKASAKPTAPNKATRNQQSATPKSNAETKAKQASQPKAVAKQPAAPPADVIMTPANEGDTETATTGTAAAPAAAAVAAAAAAQDAAAREQELTRWRKSLGDISISNIRELTDELETRAARELDALSPVDRQLVIETRDRILDSVIKTLFNS